MKVLKKPCPRELHSQKSITRPFWGSDLAQKQAEIGMCSKKASSSTAVVSLYMDRCHSRSSRETGFNSFQERGQHPEFEKLYKSFL